ncbi:DnaJ domain-containing protein [Candidatus Babeliales bacterium]|nr:DnaJ domain-containing protein [Candidatus Babeliales bacterium]
MDQANSLSITKPTTKEFAAALKILGLEDRPLISQFDIDAAYKKLALKYHPDKGGDSEMFKVLNEAKEILTNSAKNNPQTPGMISGTEAPLQITYNPTERIGKGLSHFSSNSADGLPNVEKPSNLTKPKGSQNSNRSSLPNMGSNKDLKPQAKSESKDKNNVPSKPFDAKKLIRNVEAEKPSSRRKIIDTKNSDLNLPESQEDQPDLTGQSNTGGLYFTPATHEEVWTDYTSDKRELTPEEIRALGQGLDDDDDDYNNASEEDDRPLTLEELKERNAAKRELEKIEAQEKKLQELQTTLENLPEDEDSQRESIEKEEYFANRELQAKMQNFQKEMEELKAREKEKINDENSRQAEIETRKRKQTLAEKLAEPLSEIEIKKITEEYEKNLKEKFANWKEKHIDSNSTYNDFIDFELGFKNIEPTSAEFDKKLKELLIHNFSDFKNYNEATQNQIWLKLKLTLFKMSEKPRKTEMEWEWHKKDEQKQKDIKNIRQRITDKTESLLREANIDSLKDSELYNKILDEIVPKNRLLYPTEYAGDEILAIINKKVQQIKSEKNEQIRKLKAILKSYDLFSTTSIISEQQKKAMDNSKTKIDSILSELQKPNATPIKNADFEKFETIYQKLYSPDKYSLDEY